MASEDSGYRGYLLGFPYNDHIERYSIDKKKQRATLWRQLLSPRQFCSEVKKMELIYKVCLFLFMC